MKRQFLAGALLAAIVMFSACGEQDGSLKTAPPRIKLYGLENVSVDYEYTGAASGTKNTRIANWGMYQRMEDNFAFNQGEESKQIHSIDITSDSLQYAIDMMQKKGSLSRFDFEGFEIFTDEFNEEERKDFQGTYLLRTGAKKIGMEKLLDRECAVYEMPYMAMKIWLWNGITMKSEMAIGDQMMVMTAVNIDESYSPKEEDFLPPSDVEIMDMTQGLPAGHPPVEQDGLPEGHPPMAPMRGDGEGDSQASPH